MEEILYHLIWRSYHYLYTRLYLAQVVQDFFYQQYVDFILWQEPGFIYGISRIAQARPCLP